MARIYKHLIYCQFFTRKHKQNETNNVGIQKANLGQLF